MRVPEIIEIRIDGVAGKAVAPKDVILHVLGRIKADGAVYKAIEFTGTYVESLNVAGRMVLCNMAVEMGAKTAYIQPNADVINYVNSRVTQNYEVVYSDPGFTFDEVHLFDITELTPQVAVPSSVDNVSEITSAKIRVDQCFVGTCTGGRLEDLKIAADTVRGKKIAPGVRLLIIPASAEVMQDAMEQGYIKDLMQSGATISTPGCGPCLGAHEGIMAPGEVCVTASNRNFPGRMGSTEAGLYLASPQTVAASALTGYLTDPRTLEEV